MNLQENIHRIQEMMDVDPQDKRIDVGVELLKSQYGNLDKSENQDVDYYLLDGRVIVVDEKKFKTINVNNIVWDMLDNYLGLKTNETQQVIKKWLKDSYGIETHTKDGNLRIYRYDR